MMGDVIQCAMNRVPAGGYALGFDECLDELLGELPQPVRRMEISSRWRPAADIAETSDHYRITLEVPGIDMNALEVTYENGILHVKGNKQKESEEGECCHCSERFNGSFEKSFQTAEPVDEEKIEATYRDGILKLTLPKTEKNKARKIEVR